VLAWIRLADALSIHLATVGTAPQCRVFSGPALLYCSGGEPPSATVGICPMTADSPGRILVGDVRRMVTLRSDGR
jgi:hypothetical protein